MIRVVGTGHLGLVSRLTADIPDCMLALCWYELYSHGVKVIDLCADIVI